MPKTSKAKPWIEVRVEVSSAQVEGVSNFLIELGSPGVVQEKVPGKPGTERERVVAYFDDPRSFPAQRKEIRKYLSSLPPCPARGSFRCRAFREEKWAEAWKDHFKPRRVTPHMVVKPPWEKYAGKDGESVIEIDPGMAFGTGTHPTTRMCLQCLELLIPSFFRPPSVLDFGTGSGILAIAAQKLGAGNTVAVDIDPAAVENARKNASANRFPGRIDFRVASGKSLRRRFGIVVANLLPREILNATESLTGRVSSEGFLVLSGMLRKQKEEIAMAFDEKGFGNRASKSERGWVCMVLSRKRLDRGLRQKLSASGFFPDRSRKTKDGPGKQGSRVWAN
jgi:ribosomal protein L11 methyltransferase